MSAFRDSDIDTMLADSPDEITIGAVTNKCWVDTRDEIAEEEHLIIRRMIATLKVSDFPALAKNVAASLNGVSGYKVQNFLLHDDGALAEVILTRGA